MFSNHPWGILQRSNFIVCTIDGTFCHSPGSLILQPTHCPSVPRSPASFALKQTELLPRSPSGPRQCSFQKMLAPSRGDVRLRKSCPWLHDSVLGIPRHCVPKLLPLLFSHHPVYPEHQGSDRCLSCAPQF